MVDVGFGVRERDHVELEHDEALLGDGMPFPYLVSKRAINPLLEDHLGIQVKPLHRRDAK